MISRWLEVISKNNNGRDIVTPISLIHFKQRQDVSLAVVSTHHHLARPLVAALDDVESLGEIHRRALLGTHADYLDKLTSNRIYIESGVTTARNKDDAPLGPLR